MAEADETWWMEEDRMKAVAEATHQSGMSDAAPDVAGRPINGRNASVIISWPLFSISTGK